MSRHFALPLAAALFCFLVALTNLSVTAAEFTVEKADDGVTVKIDGKLFTRYLTKSKNKPILWPIIGPDGQELTRQYPMKPAGEGEKADHPHHRSMWFTHGDVNGVSFWHENDGSGEIVHQEFTKISGGETAVIQTTNHWVNQGEVLCQDVRTLTFGVNEHGRWIDFDIRVIAPDDKAVKFGDTKEGSMGVRVAGTMKTDAGKGGKIVSSEGKTNKSAWGKPAAWVDYHGPVDGKTVGIAMLNHPSSYGYPSHWHVRTYGLFAANPFGLHDFKSERADNGSKVIEAGESMNLRYRLIFHNGDEDDARIAEAFEEYSKTNKE